MSARSYRLGVDRGLAQAFAALLGAFAATWLVVLVSSATAVGPALWAAVLTLAGIAVAIAGRAALLALDTGDAVALSAVAVALDLAWWADRSVHVTPGQRCMVTAATVFAALAFASRRGAVVAITVAVAAQAFVDVAVDGPVAAVWGLWPVLAAGIAVRVCVPALRAAAGRADHAAAARQVASVEQAAAAAEQEVQRELQGVLHDQIVSALRTISTAGISAAEARTAARVAVDAIERAPATATDATPVDLADAVREAAATAGTVTSVSVAETLVVPGYVATATVAALAEALRNVHRHARAERVRLALAPDGDGFVLRVTDDGVGFRSDAPTAGSHGLRHSVVRRMADVGGRAEVASSPGRGTTVQLSWRPRASAPAREATRAERIAAALVDVRGPLLAVAGPYLGMTGVLAIAYSANGRVAGGLAVWFVGLAALTLLLVERARSGLEGRLVAAVVGYALAGTVAAVLVLPADSLEDYSSWPLGATTSLLAVLAVVRPVREAASALAAHQAVIVLGALTGSLGVGPWSARVAQLAPAALSTVTPVVLGMIISRAVLRLGDAVTRSNRVREVAAASISASRARQAVHERRLADLGAEVLPFLRGVATGVARHEDVQVRRLARAMEHSARDELHLPGVLDREARTALHRARAAGCTVTIQPGQAAAPDADLVCRAVVAALGAGPAPRELVLSVAPSTATAVGVVATPGDADRAEALRREFGPRLSLLDATDEVTWAEIAAG